MSSASGQRPEDRLKQGGIDAKRGNAMLVLSADLFLPPPTHPLHDPRSLWPVDVALAKAIHAGSVRPNVVVRDDGIPKGQKKRRLTVIDGGRRSKAMGLVNEWRKKDGNQPRFVEIQIVSGTDAEMLLLRLALNGQRADETPSTLAYKISQGEQAGLTIEAMCDAYGCSLKLANQATRFAQCIAPVREAFDMRMLPLDVLGAFVDIPPDEQAPFLARVLPKVQKLRGAGGAAPAAKVKEIIRKTRREEGRVKPEKRAKSLPASLLVSLAVEARRVQPVKSGLRMADGDLVSAALEYAAGQPAALRAMQPALVDRFDEARKAKRSE